MAVNSDGKSHPANTLMGAIEVLAKARKKTPRELVTVQRTKTSWYVYEDDLDAVKDVLAQKRERWIAMVFAGA